MVIFETERLIVRKLILEDLDGFHEMQSNPKVMQYADGEVKSYLEHKSELISLIDKYTIPDNDFWIYAIVRKSDVTFVGTVALVKDGTDDEIGYRFLETYWGNGYATEICKGLISYCKSIGMKKLIGYVVDKNIASAKILERYNFTLVKRFVSEDIGLPESKYELIL
ncbi:GNAT family N-acetyltransferase [Tenacibaculum sp. 190524A02b]|uniref:Acetyltransferase (GNAT) domain-containing protein n=1 Tax=Tenacibaculum vairaonense TaxID=3137860 RepID=A0ABM9PPK3_9FLAO